MLNRVEEWQNNVKCKHNSGGFLIGSREKTHSIEDNRIKNFGFLHANTCVLIIYATATGVTRYTLYLLSFKVNSRHAFT